MNKVIGTLAGITVLAVMAYVVWTFKWWILGTVTTVVVINLIIEKVTNKQTRLTKWMNKQ